VLGSGHRTSTAFRSGNKAAHILILISSSSAQISATHGDPRLPNLKRRLPERTKKNNLEGEEPEDNKSSSQVQNGWAGVVRVFRTEKSIRFQVLESATHLWVIRTAIAKGLQLSVANLFPVLYIDLCLPGCWQMSAERNPFWPYSMPMDMADWELQRLLRQLAPLPMQGEVLPHTACWSRHTRAMLGSRVLHAKNNAKSLVYEDIGSWDDCLRPR
jgi:hypothetical protein